MKKKGRMTGALILLLLLVGVLAVLKKQSGAADSAGSDGTQEEAATVTDLDSGSITGISFQLKDGTQVSYTKKEDTWYDDADETFPLSGTMVTNLISQVSSISANRVLDEAKDLSEYGLEKPSNVVKLTDEKKNETVLMIGDQNASSGSWYVCLADQPEKVYLVSGAFGTMFPENRMACVEQEKLPSFTSDDITDVEVEGESSYALHKNETDSGWTVVDEAGEEHGGDADQVNTLTSGAASLSYGELVQYGCTDFAPYGLEQPSAVIRVQYTQEPDAEDGNSEEDSTKEESSAESSSDSSDESTQAEAVKKQLVLLVGEEREDGFYYVTTEGSDQVYTMTASQVETFTDSKASAYWDLYVGMENVADLKSMDITYQGVTRSIQRKVEEAKKEDSDADDTASEEVSYICDGEELEQSDFTAFYSSVIGVKAQTKEKGLTGKAEDEITIVLHMKDGDKVFGYSPYDSSFYYTKDSEGIPSLVNKNQVKEIMDNYQALFSKESET